MSEISIESWQPIALWLDEIGPFRQGLERFSFTDERAGEGTGKPSNLYMLLAKNGRGKTTALEAIFGLFGLLAEPPVGRFLDTRRTGRAQFDVRATIAEDGRRQSVLLSVWTGSETPLASWTPQQVGTEADAAFWGRLGLGYNASGTFLLDGTDELGVKFWRAIVEGRGEQPSALHGLSQSLPTVLLFPADRTIVAPEEERAVRRPINYAYQPAQCFGSDGPDWDSSIDNLLVWLEWLDDNRTQPLVDFLNKHVFTDGDKKSIRLPRRGDLLTYVSTPTGDHPLSHLSQGERALLQFYGRTLAHMTRNTIILVDEIENHLHPRWMQRMMSALKEIIREPERSVTVIFTTHNMELMETFRHDQQEEGLNKGGKIITDDMLPQRDEMSAGIEAGEVDGGERTE